MVFSYNTAVHESCDESPFYLLHGRDPDVPNAVIDGPRRVPYGSLDDYRTELTSRLQIAHDIARETLKEAAFRRKRHYDKGTEGALFRVGDRVYVEQPQGGVGLARKLSPKWRGPYRVIEQLSPVTFRVREITGGAIATVHANRLKFVDHAEPPASNRQANHRKFLDQAESPASDRQERSGPQAGFGERGAEDSRPKAVSQSDHTGIDLQSELFQALLAE